VRSLSYDTTADDLTAHFEKYGKIFYSKIVKDRDTGMSRGSAFVQFFDPEPVEKIMKDFQEISKARLNRFTTPSVKAKNFELHGRELTVDRTVPRGDLPSFLRQKYEHKTQDTRNTRLVNVGDPPASVRLTKQEQEEYKRHKETLEEKMKNPNCHMSLVRLSIHKVPKTMDEKSLKALFATAASPDGKPVKIKQVKIIRNKDQIDTDGKGKATGHAFIEFVDHSHALKALKTANFNEKFIPGVNRKLIVQFACDNKLRLWKREQKLENIKKVYSAPKSAKLTNTMASSIAGKSPLEHTLLKNNKNNNNKKKDTKTPTTTTKTQQSQNSKMEKKPQSQKENEPQNKKQKNEKSQSQSQKLDEPHNTDGQGLIENSKKRKKPEGDEQMMPKRKRKPEPRDITDRYVDAYYNRKYKPAIIEGEEQVDTPAPKAPNKRWWEQ